MHRTVQDVMTREVVVARRDSPFKEIADLFDRNDISAVPVVDSEEHPVGIVSEADLIRAEANQPATGNHAEARWLPPHGRARAKAESAGTLMSSPVVTARPEWSLVEAARAMDRRRVKHLPVIDNEGRLVGIVSRRDLLRPFLRPDDVLREEIVSDVLGRMLTIPPDTVNVTVDDGVATLTGTVERKSVIAVIERLCRAVDGVVAVHQTLRHEFDDAPIDAPRSASHHRSQPSGTGSPVGRRGGRPRHLLELKAAAERGDRPLMGSATTAVGRPKTLFDRTAEWDALAAFASDGRPGPTIGMVTGPRGQGKSYLLQELTRATGGLYFGAQEAAEAESLRRLAEQFSRHTGEASPARWRGWEVALEAVLALGTDRPVPIVLDGFPELVRQSPALPAAVQTVCRRLRDGDAPNRARVLLCGSAMPVMHRLLGSAPATADFRIEIGRLDYRQGARLWDIEDPLLALRVHAVVGSSPAFRHDAAGEDTPTQRDDFDAWVCRTVLNPRLPLFWRAGQLLEREPDGWDRALGHSALAALAAGCTTAGAIADWLERPATEVPHTLALLGDCGFVESMPDAFSPGVTHYRIAEPLLAFDHAVIRPHRGELERQEADRVWSAARMAFESSVLEHQFAQVCRAWVVGFAAPDTFGAAPATASAGSLPTAPGQAPLAADVVVRGEAHGRPGTLLSVGRAHWNEVLDVHHLHEVQQVVAALAERGEDVSRTRPALYSTAGFSPRLRDAEAHSELILVDPHRLYRGA